MRQTSRRSTSRGGSSHRSAPHRAASAAGAFVAVAALLSVGAQAGAAAADTAPQAASQHRAPAFGDVNHGALPAALSSAEHTALIKQASAATGAAAKSLSLGAKEKLVVKDVVKDRDGTIHTRYERTYDGLPVLGGDFVLETRDTSGTKGAHTRIVHLGTVKTTPTIAASAAEDQALGAAKKLGAERATTDRAPRRVVWAAQGTPKLAYETVVGGLQDDGTPNELHVITDAATGKQLYKYQGVKNGTGNTEYSGTVTLGTTLSGSTYTLNDAARGGHKTYNLNHGSSGTGTLFSGSDDVWGDHTPGNPETAGADAHYGAAMTWDYYKNTYGRNGIANDGRAAYSRVHYSNNYVNAFWDDSCFCMTYGDGDSNANPLTAIDVAGHEMTHGVTAATADLEYSGESGGLNEATSDIFGTMVEWYANNASDPGDYLIGEKINIFGDGTPLRYMDKPSKDGASADYWSSSLGDLDVHYSSGPANHFFYLLSEGSGAKVINGVSYNSPTSDGSTVTGIGRTKAALIWYKALTEQFTSTTNYEEAAAGTLAAAQALYGAGSAEYTAVQKAWTAINVFVDTGTGTTFSNTTPQAIPDQSSVTSNISVTGMSGNAPSNLRVKVDITHTYRGDLKIELLSPNGTRSLLKDSGFDSGDNVKTTYTVDASSSPASGTWKLVVTDTAALDTGTLNSWSVTFP